MDSYVKDFYGYTIWSDSSCMKNLNGKRIVKTIQKAIPDDDDSTLWVVKVEGHRTYVQVYEDEIYK